jgi:hypothetical protein
MQWLLVDAVETGEDDAISEETVVVFATVDFTAVEFPTADAAAISDSSRRYRRVPQPTPS